MMIDNDSDVWIQCKKNSIWRVLSYSLQIRIGCTINIQYTFIWLYKRACMCVSVGFVMKQRAKQWRLNKFKSRFSFLSSLFSSTFVYIRTRTHTNTHTHTVWNTLSIRIQPYSLSVWTHTGKSRIYEQVFIDFFLFLSMLTLSLCACVYKCGISLVFFLSWSFFYVQQWFSSYHLQYISEIFEIDCIYLIFHLNLKIQ